MPWLGIWFEHEGLDGGARDPRWFEGLVEPRVYPYARGFIEAETDRLTRTRDPSTVRERGERCSVYYSINHDGGQSGVDQQGCRLARWLFENFLPSGGSRLASAFSETPLVIHAVDPARAAALGNAFTLLRFLSARPDQAVAKILLEPWDPLRIPPERAAKEYERRVIDFLHGEVLYPDEVTLYDVLARKDLRSHRSLAPCCQTQMGFITSILAWIDECWPKTDQERAELTEQIRRSLADEVRYWRKSDDPSPPRDGVRRDSDGLPVDFV